MSRFPVMIKRLASVAAPKSIGNVDWARWSIQHFEGHDGPCIHDDTFTGSYSQVVDRDEAWRARKERGR